MKQKNILEKCKKLPLKQLPAMIYGVIALFALGCFLGYLTTHFLKNNIYAPLLSLYQTLNEQLQSVDADRYAVFLLAAKRQMNFFLLLWFFSFTNVWRYYYWGFSVYSGFCNGLLLSFCLLMNGTSGIWEYICFQSPQCLLYIPAYCLTLYHCQTLHFALSGSLPEHPARSHHYTGKRQMIVHQLPYFLLCAALLLLGCLVEGYFNLPLLRYLVQRS